VESSNVNSNDEAQMNEVQVQNLETNCDVKVWLGSTNAKHKGDCEEWENDHRLLMVSRMEHFIF